MDEMTDDKFVELCKEAEEAKRNVFIIVQDVDGNYRGCTTKDSKQVFVRDIGPETVLQLLLTHDGQ